MRTLLAFMPLAAAVLPVLSQAQKTQEVIKALDLKARLAGNHLLAAGLQTDYRVNSCLAWMNTPDAGKPDTQVDG